MNKSVNTDSNADNLATYSFRFILFCIILWPIIWGVSFFASPEDDLAGPVSFIVGLWIVGILSIIPTLMAAKAHYDGTTKKFETFFTICVGSIAILAAITIMVLN